MRPTLLLLFAALLVKISAATPVDSYGYDAGGQYHADNYGSSANLNLNTNIDVSDLKAKFEKLFPPKRATEVRSWYDQPTSYSPPPPPVKNAGQIFDEEMNRKAAAGDLEAMGFVARDAFYFKKDYPLAVNLFQKASDAGLRASTDLLYRLLIDPDKGVRDLDRAAKLLPILADYFYDKKDIYGQALIEGDHFPKDVARGYALREEAAKVNFSNATMDRNLAFDYETGRGGIAPNPERAIHWYHEAVWGDISAQWAPETANRMCALMLGQKDGLRTYRDDWVRLLTDEFFPLSKQDRITYATRLFPIFAPGQPIPEHPATVAGLLLTDERLGTPDYERAAKLFEDDDDPAARRELGRIYDRGWIGPRDHARAVRLWQMASDKDGAANYYLAKESMRKWQKAKITPLSRDYTAPLPAGFANESLDYARTAAEMGFVPGKILQAQWIQYNAEQNPENLTAEQIKAEFGRARQLLQEASDAGFGAATYGLGVAAEKGQGTPKDSGAALAFYRRASDEGFPLAQEKLAYVMIDGTFGVAKDPVGARVLLEKAAAKVPSAANGLGVLIYHTDGAQKGDEARKWLQKSFDGGYWPAGRNLAKFAHLGIGGAKDETQARAFLEKAAEMGGKEGAKLAAEAYTKGEIVDANAADAKRWQDFIATEIYQP